MLNVGNDEFIRALNKLFENNDLDEVNNIITRYSSFCFKDDLASTERFPDAVFNKIVDLMCHPSFQDAEDSHLLLMIFEYDWGRLTDAQRSELLIVIEKSYDKYKDWTSCFVISELLGEYYCSDASLRVMCNLKSVSNEIARSLLPHGFEHMIKETHNEKLRQQAISHLKSMKTDTSPDVQIEVETVLHKVDAFL